MRQLALLVCLLYLSSAVLAYNPSIPNEAIACSVTIEGQNDQYAAFTFCDSSARNQLEMVQGAYQRAVLEIVAFFTRKGFLSTCNDAFDLPLQSGAICRFTRLTAIHAAK